jgi:3-hydroxy-3-methylglutaryl CoA synthase
MIGITAYGAYIPRLRLSRQAAVAANGWFNPALAALAKGERAMANWDEDSLTMAVEAARDCLDGTRPEGLAGVTLASTTLPFEDRQNAGVLATALDLGANLRTMDVTASQRAATTALAAALDGLAAGPVLLVAAEKRRARSASARELLYGDGAAALLLGTRDVVAEYLGGHQISVDFVDHYRGQERAFDYGWEDRWIRDEGYLKIVPGALAGLFEKTGFAPEAIDHFIMPAAVRGVPQRIASAAGIPDGAVRDTLQTVMGEAGTAHALIMFAEALAVAKPGETVLLTGWGQGCDALLFRATDGAGKAAPRLGVRGHLARGRTEDNYTRFLAFNGLIEQEKGIRGERDKQTALSALYRKKDMVLGFVGGVCRVCGTVQFPKTNVCVNPNCGEFHSQDDHRLAEVPAAVQSWTADNLTFSPDPPHHFGMVVFEEGGRLMADFTDVDVGGVEVGMAMRMMFRIKEQDDLRGFTKYFWKAAPADTKEN